MFGANKSGEGETTELKSSIHPAEYINLEHFEEEWRRLKAKRVPRVTLLLIRVRGQGLERPNGRGTATPQLLRTAEVFAACLRQSDFLARLSEEEFGLLLPRADARGAALVCARLEKAAGVLGGENGAGLRFLFGSASGSVAQTTFSQLLQEATVSLGPDV